MLVSFTAASIAGEPHCSLLADDSERMHCHLQSAAPPKKAAAWLVSESRSMQSVVATQTANWPVQCGAHEGTVTVVLSCQKTSMRVVFSTACPLASAGDESKVIFRMQGVEAANKSFLVGGNTRSLTLNQHEEVIDLVKSWFAHDQVNVTIQPSDNQAFSASFDIAGLEEAVKPLRHACEW